MRANKHGQELLLSTRATWTSVPRTGNPRTRHGDGRLPRFSLKGLTLTWPEPCSDIWVAGLQSQAMEGDSNRSKPRCSLPSQSREVNGVAGNCGDTGMEQKLLAGIWLARTGGTLSSSYWRRQKLSPPAEFSRHCLMISSNFLDAFVCAAWLTQTYLGSLHWSFFAFRCEAVYTCCFSCRCWKIMWKYFFFTKFVFSLLDTRKNSIISYSVPNY